MPDTALSECKCGYTPEYTCEYTRSHVTSGEMQLNGKDREKTVRNNRRNSVIWNTLYC